MINKNILLKNLTTLKVGGNVDYLVDIQNSNDIKLALRLSQKSKLPIILIGSGSNILASDAPIRAIMLKIGYSKIKILKKTKTNTIIEVGGGGKWDNFVKWSVEKGLQGLECMSGIPGSVGAAPVQNIGAYGQEVKDSIYKVKAYDLSCRKLVIFNNSDCKFDYRHSIFKDYRNQDRYLIWSVVFDLVRSDTPKISYESLKIRLINNGISCPDLVDVRKTVLKIRKEKFGSLRNPLSAGSFFKNPIISAAKLKQLSKAHPEIPHTVLKDKKIKLYAGWLIEQTGWKGKSYLNARVSSKNSLVLMNPGKKAKAIELLSLSKKIQNDVKSQFDVHLEPEVRIIGDFRM